MVSLYIDAGLDITTDDISQQLLGVALDDDDVDLFDFVLTNNPQWLTTTTANTHFQKKFGPWLVKYRDRSPSPIIRLLVDKYHLDFTTIRWESVNGGTIIHLLEKSCHALTISEWLQLYPHIDINHVNDAGYTALDVAYQLYNGFDSTFFTLLQHGAKPTTSTTMVDIQNFFNKEFDYISHYYLLPGILTHYPQFGIDFDPITKTQLRWKESWTRLDAVVASLLIFPTTIDVFRRLIPTSRFHDDQSHLVGDDPTLFEYILQYGNVEQINWVLASLSQSQIDEVLVTKGVDNNNNNTNYIIKQLHHAIKNDRTDAFEAIMQFLISQA